MPSKRPAVHLGAVFQERIGFRARNTRDGCLDYGPLNYPHPLRTKRESIAKIYLVPCVCYV